MKKILLAINLLFTVFLFSQEIVTVEGYVFEADNRGYLNQAKVTVLDKESGQVVNTLFTDRNGYFEINLMKDHSFTVVGEKELFYPTKQELSTHNPTEANKVFVKMRLERAPGYAFDVTLANARTSQDTAVDAIEGAWIEIYNNTTKEEELNLKDYPEPNFQYTFQQGNHYTLMIRKNRYFTKRLEAHVNIDGCILCFEGLDKLENVTDNLTEGLQMGVILANIELNKAEIGSKYRVNNLYYDYNSAILKESSKIELDKLVGIFRDNPNILVEIGSHTDSRGQDDYNSKLSAERAQAVVDYLVDHGIPSYMLKARGYGESEPTNECVDGVECSEVKHQENRRTEMKVMSFLTENPMDKKTLFDIKLEENLESLIDNMDSSDQVLEVKVEEKYSEPDPDLKEQIATQTGDETILEGDIQIEESFIDLSQFETREPSERIVYESDTVRVDTHGNVIGAGNNENSTGISDGINSGDNHFVVEDENLAQLKSSGTLEESILAAQEVSAKPIVIIDENFNSYSIYVESYRTVEEIDFDKYGKISKIYVHEVPDRIDIYVGEYNTKYSADNLYKSISDRFPQSKIILFEGGIAKEIEED